MPEELKDLIAKINEEGVKAAEEKAAIIENEARLKAGEIIERAGKDAEEILSEAKDKITRMEASGKAALKQAARDLILGLRKEIAAMLDRLIASHVHKALSAEELGRIITTLAKECPAKDDITISLRKEDLEKLEKGFLSELRNEMKKGIALRPSEDITGGLIISYDSGRSYYDFTDKAVAEYLSLHLKPKLAEILKDPL